MLKKFFPLQITKRIYFFSILLIIVSAALISIGEQVKHFNNEVSNREKELYSVTKLLDKNLPGSFTDMLRQQGALDKTAEEQARVINKVLQPKVNEMVSVFPNIGMGYYSLEINRRVAFGPNFTPANLIAAPAGASYLDVYKTGKPILHKVNGAYIWNRQPVLELAYPLYRNGKIVGHVFANMKISDLHADILKDSFVICAIYWIVVLIAIICSRMFFKRFKLELERFSKAVIMGDAKQCDPVVPELNPILNMVRERTQSLEQVVARLESEVSRREGAEKELRSAHDEIRSILESVTDAFFALDSNWCFTYVNSEAERILKMTRKQLMGRDIRKLSILLSGSVENFQKARTEQVTVHYAIYLKSVDMWIEVTVYPSGEGLSVYFRDITMSKKDQEQILFQADLLKQVRNAVVATNLKGQITYWNKFAEDLYNCKSEEVLGKDIKKVNAVCQGLDLASGSIITNVFKRGYWEGDSEIRREDGSTLLVHSLVSAVNNSDGNPIGLVCVSIDLTERKKMEREIARLDKLHLIGEMAAGMGHEVRNPLTTVRGFMQLLEAKEKDVKRMEYYRLMIDELDRATSIITEFISLAKNKKVELKSRNLNAILDNLFPLLQAHALVSDKDIRTEFQDIPNLLLDEKEISQLVINLVRNGLEATPAGGTVTLKTFRDKRGVVMAVYDKGKGIDPDVIDKIGTPFVTTKDEGTGLGLAVSYSIAARHKAKIDLVTGPSGTTFFVKFRPLASEPGYCDQVG